jgi:hypothetical protein
MHPTPKQRPLASHAQELEAAGLIALLLLAILFF